jgi:cholesterol transport system auxiliary component
VSASELAAGESASVPLRRVFNKYLIVLVFLFSGLAGCGSLLPPQQNAPMQFDLGPLPVHPQDNPGIAATLLIAGATAGPGLDNTAMQYRLAYQDATRAESYAQHRWVNEPARLFTQRLRARFAAASRGVLTPRDGARADYALRLALDEFSQRFDRAQSAQGVMRVRASLVDLKTSTLLAQHSFSAQKPATANAPGAAKALAAATDAVIEEIYGWAARQINK